jgi:CRISPR-associated protein Cmr2
MKRLFFSLGPVQGFVGQARRTRDLWSGSFLLSYLAGCAMLEVQNRGGQIIFPAVIDDPLFLALKARAAGQQPDVVSVGSLPNQFMANVPDDFVAHQCKDAMQQAWQDIAQAVWIHFLADTANLGVETKGIFDSQVAAFFDVVYVIGDQNAEGLLEQRKSWRTYEPPAQNGDKCTLMGDWQELSGFVRSHDREKQTAFWTALRNRVGDLDLGDAERLCAIALVKRLFPKLPRQKQLEVIGWDLSDAIKNWVSTSFLAAVPWLEKTLRDHPNEAKDYLEVILKLREEGALTRDIRTEYNTDLQRLEQVAAHLPAHELTNLDGSFFHDAGVAHTERLPWTTTATPAQRQRLQNALSRLNQAVGTPASTYYALLLLDGDEMGKLRRQGNLQPEQLSERLGRFSRGVNAIVEDHSGKTVYAGGDDVLALLPMDDALPAARALRELYMQTFADLHFGAEKPVGTLSGAVVFVQCSVSLRSALRYAHHLLDDVAKDGNGRDSIAIAAMNGNGELWRWVSAWQNGQTDVIERVLDCITEFEDQTFSSKFFYKIGERFDTLTMTKADGQLYPIETANRPILWNLLVAEFLKNRGIAVNDDTRTDAEVQVSRLLNVCEVCHRDAAQRKVQQGAINADGAMMVRFLGAQGVNR